VARWDRVKWQVSGVKGKTVNLNVNVDDFSGPQANESSMQ